MVYFGKDKYLEAINQINAIHSLAKNLFDQLCCLNIIAISNCRLGHHQESLSMHKIALDLYKTGENHKIVELVLLYNIVIENLHIGDMTTALANIKHANSLAQENKIHRNLIFSKVLL